MSTCRIRIIGFVFAVLFLGVYVESRAVSEEEPQEEQRAGSIPSFVVQEANGEYKTIDRFTGRHLVFAVIGQSCPGIRPFLAFRKKLTDQQLRQTSILCIKGDAKKAHPDVGIAPDEAIEVLGLTGTPMILAIYENRVEWRLAGLVQYWDVRAASWLHIAP